MCISALQTPGWLHVRTKTGYRVPFLSPRMTSFYLQPRYLSPCLSPCLSLSLSLCCRSRGVPAGNLPEPERLPEPDGAGHGVRDPAGRGLRHAAVPHAAPRRHPRLHPGEKNTHAQTQGRGRGGCVFESVRECERVREGV